MPLADDPFRPPAVASALAESPAMGGPEPPPESRLREAPAAPGPELPAATLAETPTLGAPEMPESRLREAPAAPGPELPASGLREVPDASGPELPGVMLGERTPSLAGDGQPQLDGILQQMVKAMRDRGVKDRTEGKGLRDAAVYRPFKKGGGGG